MVHPGYASGINSMSPLHRLAARMAGGPPITVERRLSSVQVVSEARAMVEEKFRKLRKKGGKPGDFAVFVPFVEATDLGKVVPPLVLFSPSDPSADSKDLEAARQHLGQVPLGFILCWIDRQKGDYIVHAKPLILKHRALKVLEDLVENAAELKDWRAN
jgi:hypothetical protein